MSRDTVVFDDVVSALLEYSKALGRFEETALSNYATLAHQEASKLKDVIDMLVARTRTEQRRLNKEWEEGKEARKAEKIIRMKRVPRGWKTSDEA